MEAEFQQKINDSATLSPYKDQIKVDITSEGLRIQVVGLKPIALCLTLVHLA